MKSDRYLLILSYYKSAIYTRFEGLESNIWYMVKFWHFEFITEFCIIRNVPSHIFVAQGIEHRFPKPCVAGSNPAVGVMKTLLWQGFFVISIIESKWV